ncbi:hypothetical protein AAP_02557 [Ascosphaera apis ARSEF 7405]|uniref:Uncharacterized protein n=1 Tax=Ascosphaera apis ARSEF 7405 TaxID=392613 RepID=A0A167ZTY9_9EURO|nr:hypothetical protein AAP_02557 [Ascosphaera apis ARSEF 7405]
MGNSGEMKRFVKKHGQDAGRESKMNASKGGLERTETDGDTVAAGAIQLRSPSNQSSEPLYHIVAFDDNLQRPEGGRGVSSTALNDDKCQYIRHFNCGKRAFSDLLSRLSLHTDSNGRNGTISPLLCYSHLASLTSTVEWRRIPDSIGLAPTRFLARWMDAGSDVPCKSVEVVDCRAGRFSLHFISAAIHAILSASQRS